MDIRVSNDMDRVTLSVRKLVIPLPYAAAIKIAAYLLLAAQHCSRSVHNGSIDKSTLIEIDEQAPVISTKRRGTMPTKFEWKIDVDSERVLLYMGNHLFKLHFMKAAEMAQLMRVEAKKARAWAGDSTKQMVSVGHLTDAEENYRLGV